MRISSVHALLGAFDAPAGVGAVAGAAAGAADRVWSWLHAIAGSANTNSDAAAAAKKVDLVIV